MRLKLPQLLRWLALRQHLVSPAESTTADDWETARKVVETSAAGSDVRLTLEDFLSSANARRWSGQTQEKQAPSEDQRQAWLQAATTLQKEWSA